MAGPANRSAAVSSAKAPMLKLVEEADAVDPVPAGSSWVALMAPSAEAGVAVALSAAGTDAVTRSAAADGTRSELPAARTGSLRFGAAFCPPGPVGAILRARTPSLRLAGEGAAGRTGAAGCAGATTVSTLRTAASKDGVGAVTALVTVPATCFTAGCAGATTWTAVSWTAPCAVDAVASTGVAAAVAVCCT
jgi:hypothetical protein